MDLSPAPALHTQVRCRSVALLIDGDNMSPALAGKAVMSAGRLGPVVVLRVYGDARKLGAWHDAPGFRVVHAHAGKNITDMLLTVEALELSFAGTIDGFALATSDRDFTPLAQSLRARGFAVLGLVGSTATTTFRQSCTDVLTLTPDANPATTTNRIAAPVASALSPLDKALLDTLAKGPKTPAVLSRAMADAGFKIPEGYARWRSYISQQVPNIALKGSGQNASYCLAVHR